MIDNKYGYRICYQKDNEKIINFLATNSYTLARWEIDRYEKSPPLDKNNKILDNVKWYIFPVKTYLEYSLLWRGCPFRDSISDFTKRSK